MVTVAILVASALSSAGTGGAAPPALRIAVASFEEARSSWKGQVLADEIADRLALVPSWAVADRDHVRAAQEQLDWKGAGRADAQALLALGQRLKADLVVGGSLDGATVRAVLVEPGTGGVERLDARADGARPDLGAIALLKKLLGHRQVALSPLGRLASEAVDGARREPAYLSYGAGRGQLQAGHLAEAIAALERATTLDPRLARAHALLALARLQAKSYAAATAPAKTARDLAPGWREVRLVTARVEDFNERVDVAIEAYRAVLEIAPHDAVAHSNLARLYAMKRRDHVTAARSYDAAMAAEPAWPLPRFNLALSQLEIGRATEAVRLLEHLHQEDPGNRTYATTLGAALRRADRPAAAVPLLQELVAARADDAWARAELALALAEQRQTQAARAALDAEPTPRHLLLQATRGRVLLLENDADGAIKVLAETPPESARGEARHRREIRKLLGVALLKRGRAADAARELRAVVDQDPLDGEALYNLGLAQHAVGDPQAADSFRRAHEAARALVPAALALARVRLDAGDAAGAAKALRATLDAGPRDGRLRVALGVALWRLGQLADGIAELNRALEGTLSPSLEADASYDLAEMLLAAGRRDDARRAAARYLQAERRPGQLARQARAKAITR